MKLFINLIESWKKHKKEIIIGVVVSIITTAITSGVNWFIKEAPLLGETFINTFINTIYRQAALFTEFKQSNLIFDAFMGLSFGCCITLALFTIIDLNSEEFNKESSNSDKSKLITYKKLKKSQVLILILCVIGILCIVCWVFIPRSLYSDFYIDMKIIRPYMEEHDIYQLESSWVMMKSKEDYTEIYNIINEIKIENSLT